MKKLSVLSLLFFGLQLAPAMGQAKLEKLVSEREILINQWNDSEDQKSGIFGNRTKKDMIETNSWLQRIINKDNQIMEELKLLSSIESAELGQEKEDYKSIAFRCKEQVQILKRVISEKELEIDAAKQEKRPLEWASLILFLTSLAMGLWLYRVKKAT